MTFKQILKKLLQGVSYKWKQPNSTENTMEF